MASKDLPGLQYGHPKFTPNGFPKWQTWTLPTGTRTALGQVDEVKLWKICARCSKKPSDVGRKVLQRCKGCAHVGDGVRYCVGVLSLYPKLVAYCLTLTTRVTFVQSLIGVTTRKTAKALSDATRV